jgi:hypothetical protein
MAGQSSRVAGRTEVKIVPCHFDEANAFVEQYHRHHPRTWGYKFAIAIADESGAVRGVVIVARPVARVLDDGWTLEVTRLCTDGVKNGCSMLYAAAWRAARAMGYRKLVTYILESESGVSLTAAGWKRIGECGGGTWSRPNSGRPRVDKHPLQGKIRFEIGELLEALR